MPSLDAKLAEILNELQKAASHYAPGALALGLATIRAIAIIHMAWGLLALLVFAAALAVYVRTYPVWKSGPEELGAHAAALLNVFAALVGLVFFWVLCAAVFNVTNWLALFDPRLALAKMILERVGLTP